MSTPRKLLLVGPMPIEGDVIGGTKVSFANLVEVLCADDRFEVQVHDISRALRGRGRIGRALANARSLWTLLAHVLLFGGRYDALMFNTSSGGALQSGPFLWAACKLRRLPLALRVFGGDLDTWLEEAPRTLRWLATRSILRAELVLVQTELLQAQLPARVDSRWWPTTRDFAAAPACEHEGRRFLFLSQLRAEKGVAEALAASDGLPGTATLSLYGPAMPGFDVANCGAHAKAEYRGPLHSDEVRATLAQHDVLVFPSYHGGEGMPGILIEALQTGLPVICSSWRALPEIIRDGENGLLVAPRSVDELGAAMNRLAVDDELFAQLSRGALDAGERYRGQEWNAKLTGWLLELMGHHAPEHTTGSFTSEGRSPSEATLHEEAA